MEHRVAASFVRGGTSKGLIFHAADLPADRRRWDEIFLSAMGSPDPYGRQLNGMGGGLSSLSKVCVVEPSTRSDADVEYTFAQVQIGTAKVDYSGNCGNMASAIGPFAVDEGLVAPGNGNAAAIRLFNRNTQKVVVSHFAIKRDRSLVSAWTVCEGVEGPATEVQLDFLDPGGASTGQLLPTGSASETLELLDKRTVQVSMIDAANPCVFVTAQDLGLVGTESPAEMEARPAVMKQLTEIREIASVSMGISPNADQARNNRMTPLIAIVGAPAEYSALDGTVVNVDEMDLTVRFLSNGQPHRAIPATGAMCTAAAAITPGTVVQRFLAPLTEGSASFGLGHASGRTIVKAELGNASSGEEWTLEHISLIRTTRRLFEGTVYVTDSE